MKVQARAAAKGKLAQAVEREEWEALYCTVHKTATPPGEAPSLREAVRWLGKQGGFLGRKRDREPGVTVLWRGLNHLVDLTTMYRIMRPPAASSLSSARCE